MAATSTLMEIGTLASLRTGNKKEKAISNKWEKAMNILEIGKRTPSMAGESRNGRTESATKVNSKRMRGTGSAAGLQEKI